MEKDTNDLLMKPRSYRACIADGLRLYNRYFRSIFKASWLMALLYAAMCALLGTLVVIRIPALTLSLMAASDMATLQTVAIAYRVTVGLIMAIAMVGYAIEALTYAAAIGRLKEHQDTGHISEPVRWLSVDHRLMWRTLKGFLSVVAIVFVVVFLLSVVSMGLIRWGGLSLRTVTGLSFLALLAVGLLLMPVMPVLMKYILRANTRFWPLLRRDYGVGMRHFGLVFCVLLLTALMLVIIQLIVALPALILAIANDTARTGMLLGDPLGMPSYMTALTAATFFFAGLLVVYIRMPLFFTSYYMYGSIETQEQERQQQQQQLNLT